MRKWLLVLLLGSLVGSARAQAPTAPSPVFQIGEELQYAVKWRFIRLGTITIRTLADTADGSDGRARCEMIVESSSGLPVVSLQEHNEAVMDIVRVRSLSFAAIHLMNGHRQTIHHSFLPEQRMATAELVEGENERVVRETIRDVDWYVEGVSLFFFARDAARKGGLFHVPTLVNQAIARTTLSVDDAPEELSIDAWGSPIRTHRFVGEAEWSGGSAAGVTGDFVGWATDDDASIMVRAELEIFLGSIDIELEHWRREGWKPPSTLSAARQ